MAIKKLTPLQKEVLRKMQAENTNKIYRWPGGYWTTRRWDGENPGCWYDVPDWHVGTNTVRSMRDKGALKEISWNEYERS